MEKMRRVPGSYQLRDSCSKRHCGAVVKSTGLEHTQPRFES